MLNKIIKISFSILGAITGFTILRTTIKPDTVSVSQNMIVTIYVLFSLLLCALFYFMAAKIIEFVGSAMDKFESRIQSITLFEMLLGAVGLIVGLIVANLVCIPIVKIDIIGVPFAVVVNFVLGFTGIILASRKRNENIIDALRIQKTGANKLTSGKNSKLLDTSIIIDGRILDICNSGFLEGEIIIPSYVLEELRHVADSSDPLKRARGRRGLDVLNLLQKVDSCIVRIEDIDFPDIAEVDEKLLKSAHKLKSKLLTTDYNLSKVASLRGVTVLNINELANAMKPVALPGEEMNVQIMKDGKESGQGVAFLEDGTMIVIEGGKKYMGDTVKVLVTSVLQTSAGRMVFAKLNK